MTPDAATAANSRRWRDAVRVGVQPVWSDETGMAGIMQAAKMGAAMLDMEVVSWAEDNRIFLVKHVAQLARLCYGGDAFARIR